MKQTIASSAGKVRSGKRQKGREKRRAWKQKRSQETTAHKNQDKWSHWEACAKQNHQTSHENTMVKSVRKPKLDTSFQRRKAPKKKNYQSIGERKQWQHNKYWARESTCKLKQYQFVFAAEWPSCAAYRLGEKRKQRRSWKKPSINRNKRRRIFQECATSTNRGSPSWNKPPTRKDKQSTWQKTNGRLREQRNERKSDGKNKQTKESMT